MKKKIIVYSILGFPIGISISYVISIIISLFLGNGKYFSVSPQLLNALGTEMNAVVFQTILSGIWGSIMVGGNVIWQLEKWNVLQQTLVYFSLICTSFLIISYNLYWMPRSIFGFLFYLFIFILIFFIIWIIMYFVGKHNVKKINEKLSKNNI